MDQEGCVRPKTSAAQKLPGTVNNNSVELYLPEYKNIGSTKPATMSVTLKLTEEVEVIGEDGKPVIGEDGKPKTEIIVDEIPFQAGIKFMIYDANGVAIANSDYDIVRNHHYIFTITGAEVGHRLMLRVVDIPWDDAQKIEVDYTQTIGWKDSGEPNWSVTPVTEGEFDSFETKVKTLEGGVNLNLVDSIGLALSPFAGVRDVKAVVDPLAAMGPIFAFDEAPVYTGFSTRMGVAGSTGTIDRQCQ